MYKKNLTNFQTIRETKGPGKWGRVVADTNVALFAHTHSICCGQKFCVRNKCFPVCTAQETWATMCPQECVLVYQGLKCNYLSSRTDVFLKDPLFSKSTLNLVHFDTKFAVVRKILLSTLWQGSLGSSVWKPSLYPGFYCPCHRSTSWPWKPEWRWFPWM